MNNREKVLTGLQFKNLCDDCLSTKSGVEPRQTVNIICREFASQKILRRRKSSCQQCLNFKIVNTLINKDMSNLDLTNFKRKVNNEVNKLKKVETKKRPWYWEGNVQNRIVAHLKTKGYEIINEADTASREAGVDIRAINTSGKELLISVKGYPDRSKNTQARHWFSQAIFDIIIYKQNYPDSDLAIGLPSGFTTYNNLIPKVLWLKKTTSFSVFWVSEGGQVIQD